MFTLDNMVFTQECRRPAFDLWEPVRHWYNFPVLRIDRSVSTHSVVSGVVSLASHHLIEPPECRWIPFLNAVSRRLSASRAGRSGPAMDLSSRWNSVNHIWRFANRGVSLRMCLPGSVKCCRTAISPSAVSGTCGCIAATGQCLTAIELSGVQTTVSRSLLRRSFWTARFLRRLQRIPVLFPNFVSTWAVE